MKNGFALITCLAIVLVVALGTAGILQAIGSHSNMKANLLQEVQAKYLAEAGMEYALWQCSVTRGGSGCVTTPTLHTIDGREVYYGGVSLGGGFYTIQTTVNDYTNQ